jgi:hypothetical protein
MMSSTVSRVPLMTGLPNMTSGRCSMYCRQSISSRLLWKNDTTGHAPKENLPYVTV